MDGYKITEHYKAEVMGLEWNVASNLVKSITKIYSLDSLCGLIRCEMWDTNRSHMQNDHYEEEKDF